MLEVVGERRGMARLSLCWSAEVGEGEPGDGVGQWWGVTCFVLPGLEVHRLGWSDREQDAEYFRARDALGERGVEARAPLFDEGEVEAGGVRDCLQMPVRFEIGVAA